MANNGLVLDDLQINIAVDATKAAKGLTKLSNELKASSVSAKDSATNLRSVSSSIKDLGTVTSKTKSKSESIAAVATDLKETAKAADEAKVSLNGVATAVKSTAKTSVSSSSDVEKVYKKLDGELKQTASQASKTSSKLSGVAKSAKSSFKEVGDGSKAATGKLAQFFASIKRIAMYRAIRSALKGIAAAFKEGFEMFVNWDREQNNGLAGASKMVDEFKAKWFTLKGAIGAAVAPILQSLAPAIEWVSDKLTDLINFIQQVVRALRGEEVWYRAIYVDAKNTTKEAKELKGVLFGFDELNVLPSNTTSVMNDTAGYIKYVRENIPSWMKLIKPIGAGVLGLTGLVLGLKGLKSILEKLKTPLETAWDLISNLLGIHNKTVKVKADTKELDALKKFLEQVKGDAENINKYFKENVIKFKFEKPKFSLSDYRNELDNTIKYADKNPVKIKALIPNLDFKRFKQSVVNTISWATNNPIEILSTILDVDFSDFKRQLADEQANLTKNPIEIIATIPELDFKEFKETVTSTNTWTQKNPIYVNIALAAKSFVEDLGQFLDDLQKELDKVALGIPITIKKNKIGDDIGNLLKDAQKKLNENPLVIPYKIGTVTSDKQNPDTLVNNTKSLNGTFGGGKIGGGTSGGGKLTGKDDRTFLERARDWINDIFYADGGVIPNVGSLFIAGESGPEVVANMGHSTGVMNVDQMEAAISNGNAEVVAAVMQVVRAVNSKNFDVYMDSAKVGKSVTNYQNNAARRTGTPQIIGG